MIVRSNALEMVEHMFCAVGRPKSQQMVIGIQQTAAATHGDESGVALRREDHEGHSKRNRLRALGLLIALFSGVAGAEYPASPAR